jgi:hypothetical protein
VCAKGGRKPSARQLLINSVFSYLFIFFVYYRIRAVASPTALTAAITPVAVRVAVIIRNFFGLLCLVCLHLKASFSIVGAGFVAHFVDVVLFVLFQFIFSGVSSVCLCRSHSNTEHIVV